MFSVKHIILLKFIEFLILYVHIHMKKWYRIISRFYRIQINCIIIKYKNVYMTFKKFV